MQLVNTSINFDLKSLEYILRRIQSVIPEMSDFQINKILESIKNTKVDEWYNHSLSATYAGEIFPLGFRFWLDDIDSPDAEIFGTKQFIAWLNNEFKIMMESE